ncbi:ATP-binding protein, partial [Nonomuraea thailandensis]
SLPPTDESPHVAGVWARGITLAEMPDLADGAEQLARNLVATAVRRTPPDGRIHIEIETTAEGLRLLVRDPRTPDPVGSREWSEISSFTLSFGTQSGPEGHEAWALLRSPDAVPA